MKRPTLAWRRTVFSSLAAAAAAVVIGCSTSTDPETPSDLVDGADHHTGTIDPSDATFVLQRVTQTIPDREPIQIDLIGRRIEANPLDDTVLIEVAIANAWTGELFAPAIVWLDRFTPRNIVVLNPDLVEVPDDSTGTAALWPVGFDYSETLGDDGVLAPGETSEFKSWVFHAPDLAAFSFDADVELSIVPDRGGISGLVFADANANGRRDRDERPIAGAIVEIQAPEGDVTRTTTNERGVYRTAATWPGLYTLTLMRPRVPNECLSTPNPLEVVLPPASVTRPATFDAAHFGVIPGCGEIDQVVLADGDLDDIHQDPYDLQGIHLEGDILTLRIGMSGCSDELPFRLVASTAFMESFPVRTKAVLSYMTDDCDAAWSTTRTFDLSPLRRAYIEAYGEPGQIIIRLTTPRGEVHEILFGP